MSPKISIIVPVYNAKSTLHKCVDSIIHQSYKDWELLLIDDGSTDTSATICDKYAQLDNHIKVFRKQNGGVSSARNIGLDNAKGEWITFVDSDDYTYENWLDNFIFEIDKDKNVDMVMQGFKVDKPLWNDENNKEIYYRRFYGINYVGSVDNGILLMDKNAMKGYLWIKIFKHKIIKNYGIRFDCRFSFLEDEEFCLRYSVYCKKILFTDKIGYFYNVPNCGKYKRNFDDFYLFQSLYECSISIFHKCRNLVSDSYLDRFTEQLLFSYLYKDANRRKKLKEYRLYLGRYILNTNLFWLTKYIIYWDCVGYIADFCLRLHVKLKSSLKVTY
jgi:glycosyltransferase involved in cell wall biosynthesis